MTGASDREYPDGKWDCGEAPKHCQTLEEYLAYVEPFLTIIRRDTRGH